MTLDDGLKILGAVVPLLSAVASFLNHLVRVRKESGAEVSTMLAGTGAALNVGALNLDKAIQLLKLIKEATAEKPVDPPAAGSDQ